LQKKLFEKNSHWWPTKLNAGIRHFCNKLQNEIGNLHKTKIKHNLTKREFHALNKLKHNKNIIIKKGDKSSGIVIMDREEYENKINAMLNDQQVYTKTNIDDTTNVKDAADRLLTHLYNKIKLNKKQVENLTHFNAKCPTFYGIPKTHKAGNPLRPIVSQINGPTSSISKYVSELLAIAEKEIPFILQDTTAFLQIIDKLNVNNNTKLVTMDVTSLYTNIPHQEGAEWVTEFYHETLNKWPKSERLIEPISSSELKELILFILNNCTFEFNGEYYRQNYGTTMGASFSVRFANIYMHKFFEKFFNKYKDEKPVFIARLIDDVFFTWDQSEEGLNRLIYNLNNEHATIQFEPTISDKEVNFLDTIVCKIHDDDKLHTKLYRKPTYRVQYLHYKSNHPQHVKKAIPYSQALRYRRIIANDTILNVELNKLNEFFQMRKYPVQLIVKEIDKIKQIARKDTLIYKTDEQKKENFLKFTHNGAFLPLIITFDERYNRSLRKTVLELWKEIIETDKKLIDIFKLSTPQIVFKRGQTISNLLVRAKFKTQTKPKLNQRDYKNIEILAELHAENMSSVAKCNKRFCKCCETINVGDTFTSTNTKQQYYVEDDMDCNSENVIYIITCKRCRQQYVGETERRLKDRLNGHRSNIKNKQNTAVAIHFNNYGHSITDLNIMPIEKLKHSDKKLRQNQEKFWIKTLKTNYPNGLNYYPIEYKKRTEQTETK